MRARLARTPGFSLVYQLKISRMRSFIFFVPFPPRSGAGAAALRHAGKCRPELIAVPIVVMQAATVARGNIFDSPMPGLYVKNAACAHQHAPTMHAFRSQMRWDHGFD